MKSLIDKLQDTKLNKTEFLNLLENKTQESANYLFEKSHEIQQQHYGNKVYIRGLIEFSNYCKNNCYYCGIGSGNTSINRYRLSQNQILDCCKVGYNLGFRTFVLQGGEDPFYTDDIFEGIIMSIKNNYPDCAITLSVGERTKESYRKLKKAGADRFLLRFESSNSSHYSRLHPENLTIEARKECIYNLKDLGYTVGSGFMVGSPYQTSENIAEDLLFLQELQPDMVGLGPFIPHNATRFKDFSAGTLEDTLYILAIVRVMIPKVLLPATTALSTIDLEGRKKAIQIGCNVVMPNLSPNENRSAYQLYDNKAYLGSESAQSLEQLRQEMQGIGYEVVVDRGDPII